MEEYYNSTENIGLQLSGVMTFFFSTVYHPISHQQYCPLEEDRGAEIAAYERKVWLLRAHDA